jgi:hypothetical protein
MRLRLISAVVILALVLNSCQKDKFQTNPQISFKRYSNNAAQSGGLLNEYVYLQVTDKEGDFDNNCYIYIKNLVTDTARLDSINFPDLTGISTASLKDFELSVNIGSLLAPSNQPSTPYTDTLLFRMYIKDKAGNQSNVLDTPEPFYLITP